MEMPSKLGFKAHIAHTENLVRKIFSDDRYLTFSDLGLPPLLHSLVEGRPLDLIVSHARQSLRDQRRQDTTEQSSSEGGDDDRSSEDSFNRGLSVQSRGRGWRGEGCLGFVSSIVILSIVGRQGGGGWGLDGTGSTGNVTCTLVTSTQTCDNDWWCWWCTWISYRVEEGR